MTHQEAKTIQKERQGKKILVVDDNEAAVTALAKLLEYVGHEVITAYNGPSALETLGHHHPEVILLDIGLPGMSGYDIAKKIRENPNFSNTIIVAISGYGQKEDMRKSQEAGFNYHLIKPVGIVDLQKILGN